MRKKPKKQRKMEPYPQHRCNLMLFNDREPVVVFSGGMSYDRTGRTPSITVMAGKSTTVLEMEHNVVDFVSLCDTPWVNGRLS